MADDKVRKFTIVRSLWFRGEGDDDSKLRRIKDGKQCCLGFYLEACGVKLESLDDIASPMELVSERSIKEVPKQARWLLSPSSEDEKHDYAWVSTPVCNSLMQLNDELFDGCNDEELQ